LQSRSARLIEYLAALAQAEPGADLVQGATLALLDNIGCGFYGSKQDWGRIVREFGLSQGSRGKSTLYGSTRAVMPTLAALANGTATHGFELDDIILGSLTHPGAIVVSAALAVAEHRGVTGRRLLTGLIAGYETMARVGRALGVEHNNRGYHTTGVAGPVAAAVAAGIVMEFSVPQLQSAIGIACSSSAGIKAFTQGTGGMVKRMHAGRAAEAGVLACELAARGFTGPTQAIDGRFGLLEVIAGADAHPEYLDQDLGQSPAITRIWVKAYPCCGFIHSTSHALESLKTEHKITPRQVKQIRVWTNAHAVDHNGAPDPRETMAAQYSIPYCAGVALAADARDPAAYAAENLFDPQVRALTAKTVLAVDGEMDRLYPEHNGARVEVELHDGRTLGTTVIDPHGTPADPCTADDIERKFRLSAGATKTRNAVERIIETVRGLPAATTLENLSAALRKGNRRN
jgi:2-methylcitrate dehydratase PrpD